MINLHAEVLKVSFNITLTSIEARWLGGHDIQSDQNQPQIVCQEAGLIKKLYSIEVCEDQTLDFLCGCILCSLLIIFVHLMIHKNSNLDDSFLSTPSTPSFSSLQLYHRSISHHHFLQVPAG